MTAPARALIGAASFAVLALAFGWRIQTRELHRRSEERVVLIVEEMATSGSWLVPTLMGEARLQKPPLHLWLGAAATHVSPLETPETLRALSALAALGLVALVFAWGRSLGGDVAGWASAVSLLAMGQLWSSGTLGTADMLLAFFSTAALRAFDARSAPALAAFGALAFLTKATAALVDVLVPIALWLAWTRAWRDAARPRALGWVALTVLISLAWYALVLLAVPDAAAQLREFFLVPLGAGHSDLASDHYRPIWWYLPRVLAATAPAVLLLPLVVRDGARSGFWRDQPRLRFLATSALSLLVAWSLVPQKGQHYLLPILPLFALLVGHALARARPR